MLVLTRRIGEEILIGDDVRVVVVALTGGKVRLGVTAPPTLSVDRKEVAVRRKLEELGLRPPRVAVEHAANRPG